MKLKHDTGNKTQKVKVSYFSYFSIFCSKVTKHNQKNGHNWCSRV